MRINPVWGVLLLLAQPCAAASDTASDLSGTWQGDPAHVLELTHKKGGGYRGEIHYLGESGGTLNGNPVSVTLSGQALKFSLERRDGSFDGSVSADGKSIAGTWKAGAAVLPVTFTRASADFVIDPSPHKGRFVTVDKGVKLEVLDWGGNGPPLVLLAGLGNTAHNFDKFALNFTAGHHVYAITRRGHGVSSTPLPTIANYDADRLGDDVIAVIDALKLQRPVLAGHSLAGEELSSIGSRHPEKVSGLIYLDAGYAYAYYTPGGGIPPGVNSYLDARELRQSLDRLADLNAPRGMAATIDELLQSLPDFQKDLTVAQMEMKLLPVPAPGPKTETVKVSTAILGGAHKYTNIKAPVLAFFALPHAMPENASAATKAFVQANDMLTAVHAKAFEAGVQGSHVVRLANSDHYVYRSNEAEVIREMNAFMDALAQKQTSP